MSDARSPNCLYSTPAPRDDRATTAQGRNGGGRAQQRDFAAPDEVFAALNDVSRFHAWQPDLLSASVEGDGPLGHGAGKLILPVLRRRARQQLAENHQRLKERLESGSA
jgi:hypothetical protein